MTTTAIRAEAQTDDASVATVDMKLEVIVIPVSDVDRATEFYRRVGWRQDVTPPGFVQFTPQGSPASVLFGPNASASSEPGSAHAYVIVSDVEQARNSLLESGIEVGEIYHLGAHGPVDGLDPERGSYRSLADFRDPDGNLWVLQEVTSRLPGRVDSTAPTFGSARDLADALRRAEAAHAEHEARTGTRDENWADWYAAYLAAEQTGSELPR